MLRDCASNKENALGQNLETDLFLIVKCISCQSFVSRCGHLSRRSRRFHSLLLVFTRRWGRLAACHNNYESWWSADVGSFRTSLFRWEVVFREVQFEVVPAATHWRTDLLLCFLIAVHASGISIPLSLLMLSGWSLMWIASLTLRVHQCEYRTINFTSFQSGWWPFLLSCLETAKV